MSDFSEIDRDEIAVQFVRVPDGLEGSPDGQSPRSRVGPAATGVRRMDGSYLISLMMLNIGR